MLFSLTACSDSSDVGLGVGSDPLQGGQPATIDVTPALDTTQVAPITGDNALDRPSSQDAWRFLVGTVDDPVPGTGVVETNGYVDFSGRSSIPSEIASADSDSIDVELRLTTNYFHGYTTESMDVELYDLTAEATMDSARATASFAADEMTPASVDMAQITPTDSLVTIELRQSWIDTNLGTLLNTGNDGGDFEEAFHGFKVVAPGSEAVVGFSSSTATLRLRTVSAGDTVTADYVGLKTFTHVEQQSAGSPPSGYQLMQDGVGTGLTMAWDFETNPLDTLGSDPLNRAEIFVPNDTSALEGFTPTDFERPQPQGYRIIATRSTAPDAPSCSAVRSVVFSVANEACVLPLLPSAAPSAALVADNVSFPIFERSLRRVRTDQSPVFTTYRVHVADRENTSVDQAATVQPGLPTTLPALVPIDGTDPGPPRATLTVTPL